MKRKVLMSVLVFGISCISPRLAPAAEPLRLVATIPLENVKGRIDHFGIDVKGKRLFMSALGNNTVEVFDLRANKRIHTITGLHEPQGTTYASDANKLYVANSDDGTVQIFDGTSFKLLHVLHFSSDADDTRYDAKTNRVFVGYGDGAVAAIDTTDDKVLGEIEVPAHPEAYEVEKGGEKIFINVPNADEIAVGEWSAKRVIAHWRTDGYAANFPMALNSADHRIFVVTRRPAQFLALDMASGRIISHLGAVGDADDIWYDAARKRIYISGGEGFLSVIEQQDPDHYRIIAKIPTAAGARTSYFSPDLARLYLAVPDRGGQAPELRVYETSH